MYKIIKIFAVLVVITLKFETSHATKFKCEVDGSRCYLNNLELARNDEIEPVTSDLNAITLIQINGIVPVLSARKICAAFPNLETFDSDKVSIEEIHENAFLGCNKLKRIELDENKFTKLNRKAFKGLFNLEGLLIGGGNLPNFDLDLTDSKNLKTFLLRNLNIMKLPGDIFREQANLERLFLYTNNFFDLNIEELVKNTPKLKYVYLEDNHFTCSRLREILDHLKKKNINGGAWDYYPRKRSYSTEKINGIDCLTDEQRESEMSKLPIEQQLMSTLLINNLYNNLTSLITKLEISQNKSEEMISNLNTKMNDDFGERFSNLQTKFENHLETTEEKILNLQKNNKIIMGIVNEQLDDGKMDAFNEEMETLDKKIETLEANQTEQISKLETKVESKLETIENQISKITQTLKTINERIEAQDSQMLKLQENFNKGLETLSKQTEVTSNLMVSLSSGLNMLDLKFKDSKDDTKKELEQLHIDLQKSQNETRTECYKILNKM